MATKHEQGTIGNSTAVAGAAVALMARSKELGQRHVATVEEVAETRKSDTLSKINMNAPARPIPRPGQPDLPADLLPALDPLALKAY